MKSSLIPMRLSFNPRSPWGERPSGYRLCANIAKFQSTLPVGGATLIHGYIIPRGKCFNPRSPWGERRQGCLYPPKSSQFQSTLPVGGATIYLERKLVKNDVSIHAPRGGSDGQFGRFCGKLSSFNPRSPWGERPGDKPRERLLILFQSTLPVGGATSNGSGLQALSWFQSTLPVGGATWWFHTRSCVVPFQSTLPVGGATARKGGQGRREKVSIHAPRGGSDFLE